MFCIYCGATLPADAEKCTICGNPVVLPEPAAPAPAEPVRPEPETPQAEAQPDAPAPEEVVPEAPVQQEPEDLFSGEPISEAYSPAEYDPRGDFPEEQTDQSGYLYQPPVQAVPVYDDGYVYEEELTPRRKRSFKWLLIAVPIVLAIVGTVTGILLWYNAPMQKLTRALDAYDYAGVTQLLPQLSDTERASLYTEMEEYAETVIDRYNRGEAEYASSYELLDRLQRLFPDAKVSGAADRLAALKASKDAFKQAQKLEQQGDTAGAISRYGEVIREDTNYDTAQKQIEAIRTAYKAQVLEEAQKLAEEKDFSGARAVLQNSTAILGDDADIAAKLEELEKTELDDYVENLLKTAETLVGEDDYAGAVQLLSNATREDARIDKQIQAYKDAYKEKMLAEAADYADASDYEEAVAVLEKSQSLLGDDADIAAKIAEYKSLYPVRLIDLSPTGGADCASGWTAQDAFGNMYSNGLSFTLYPILATSVSTEYSPYGRYRLLSGTWVVESDSTEDFSATVRIYVDGSLQYEVSALTRNSQPVSLNLQISGAQTVRIEVDGRFGSPRASGYVYLAGATFHN
ncbi:MAG: hypothetical protein ACI4GO_02195 [Hominenteromicrobium sp.]